MISRATMTAIHLADEEIEKTIISIAEAMKDKLLNGHPIDAFNPHELAHEVLKG